MKTMGKTVILYESIGFGFIVILLWLSEIVDLPHLLFGVQATPLNWVESAMESVFVIALGITVITVTFGYIRKIKYLEGFLPVCSYCKRIRVKDQWVPIEEYITDHSEAMFSHGFCPVCAEKYYRENFDDLNRM